MINAVKNPVRQYNALMTREPENDRIPCILLAADELGVLMNAPERSEFEDHICNIAGHPSRI